MPTGLAPVGGLPRTSPTSWCPSCHAAPRRRLSPRSRPALPRRRAGRPGEVLLMRISAAGATTGTAAGTATPAAARAWAARMARIRVEAAAPTASASRRRRAPPGARHPITVLAVYAHLPAKRAAYAHDPVQALTLLRAALPRCPTATSTSRDRHRDRAARRPHPLRRAGRGAGQVAALPFLVEQYGPTTPRVPGDQGRRTRLRRPRLHPASGSSGGTPCRSPGRSTSTPTARRAGGRTPAGPGRWSR